VYSACPILGTCPNFSEGKIPSCNQHIGMRYVVMSCQSFTSNHVDEELSDSTPSSSLPFSLSLCLILLNCPILRATRLNHVNTVNRTNALLDSPARSSRDLQWPRSKYSGWLYDSDS